jgi:outer membrane receptor for ferrienterochelin and colicin
MGVCLATLAVAPALAQSATGAVAGRADAGTQVTVTSTTTGLTRTVTVDADGSYRLSPLPVGNYQLQVKRNGAAVGTPVAVNVELGGTTTVNLGSSGNVVNLDSITVVGSQVVNRVDVNSTESATNITREELTRLPVNQTLGSVALLAPGVVGGNSSFGGISFGGSSVAENSVYINGLNVTDFYRRQSFSTVPFAFFDQYQIKTGGYSVEFGRSTGGVINAVTRSGGNEFMGGMEFTFEPEAWREQADDHSYFNPNPPPGADVYTRASRDTQSAAKLNAWASGPVVKDRLFMFAMYELRDNESNFTNAAGSSWTESESSNGFWATKLDWNLTNDHVVEFLAFSDEGDTGSNTYAYNFNAETIGGRSGDNNSESGGTNGSITYTGFFGENFVAKAMYGLNQTQAFSRSTADELCDIVTFNAASYNAAYNALGRPVLGCHPGGTVINHEDEREVARLDFEWTLGDHLLRFGIDHELMTTDRNTRYPGPTQTLYTIFGRTSPTQVLDNGTPLPAGVNAFLMGRRRADGGVFETEASAFYLEDVWHITPNFLLNLGVRLDSFDNKTAVGTSFIKMDNLFSPRVGFSWDMKGDGSTKLFGNLGRYYLPVANTVNYTFAGGLTDERTFYALNGYTPSINPVTGAPYAAPIFGPQIGPVDTSLNISVADLRKSVDRDIDAVYQDEAILGFQSAISQAWSWGVNGTYRRMHNAIDDIRINHTPCGNVASGTNGGIFPIGNPGQPLTIWGDASIGCATPGWITIDTSRDGYSKQTSNEVTGYFEPKRTYKAVEFQIDRAWDGKWEFNASYLWSKSEGNHEGPVNSDTNYADTGIVQHWDHPANNDRYGPLFNDHRHQIKLRGSYQLNEMWTFGGTLTAQSGGPITAFGVTWPNDTRAAGSFTTIGSGGGSSYLCVAKCSGNDPVTGIPYTYTDRVYQFTPRGGYGNLPWTYNLGANVQWTLPIPGVDLKARLSVFNLLNEQEVINVVQRYESNPGVRRPEFGTGTRWQSPRYAQLVVTYNF